MRPRPRTARRSGAGGRGWTASGRRGASTSPHAVRPCAGPGHAGRRCCGPEHPRSGPGARRGNRDQAPSRGRSGKAASAPAAAAPGPRPQRAGHWRRRGAGRGARRSPRRRSLRPCCHRPVGPQKRPHHGHKARWSRPRAPRAAAARHWPWPPPRPRARPLGPPTMIFQQLVPRARVVRPARPHPADSEQAARPSEARPRPGILHPFWCRCRHRREEARSRL
mmetsp:Transcript_27404/g.88537  ORF Transcript_27404/g.88537 Transcript_27404/m.88537 type:complete len:222 (-) Transcript_27404:2501-3166(-)